MELIEFHPSPLLIALIVIVIIAAVIYLKKRKKASGSLAGDSDGKKYQFKAGSRCFFKKSFSIYFKKER